MTIFAFPQPAFEKALLENLSPQEAANALVLALEDCGDAAMAQRLRPGIEASAKLLDEMATENLEYALMGAFVRGEDWSLGLDLEWQWTLSGWIGVALVLDETPQALEGRGETADALLAWAKTNPLLRMELSAVLSSFVVFPEIEDSLSKTVGGAWPRSTTPPQPGAELWEHLVWRLQQATPTHQANGLMGPSQSFQRLFKAMLTVRSLPKLEDAPERPSAPVIQLAKRRAGLV